MKVELSLCSHWFNDVLKISSGSVFICGYLNYTTFSVHNEQVNHFDLVGFFFPSAILPVCGFKLFLISFTACFNKRCNYNQVICHICNQLEISISILSFIRLFICKHLEIN